MLSKKMQTALNKQVDREFFAEHLYLAISAYFESLNLPGMAAWMRHHADEERVHALKIYDFIHNCRGRVLLGGLDKPETEWESPLAAFKAALAHEQKVTKYIDELVELAQQEKNHGAGVFLQWFVNEQIEEEKIVGDVIPILERIADHPGGLFMIDSKLGGSVPARSE